MKVEYDNLEVLRLLTKVCRKYKASSDYPIEAKEFHSSLLKEYDGEYDMKQLKTWLEERLAKYYIALKKRPRWIQSPDWPFYEGKPMTFIGQVDIVVRKDDITERYFHDDISFYLFIGPDTSIYEVVVQQI